MTSAGLGYANEPAATRNRSVLDSRLATAAPVADAVCPFVEGIDQRFPLLRSIVDASIVASSAQLVAGSAGIGSVSGSRGGAVKPGRHPSAAAFIYAAIVLRHVVGPRCWSWTA